MTFEKNNNNKALVCIFTTENGIEWHVLSTL